MECVTRMVKLKGKNKAKNIRIFVPEAIDVISPDFSYAKYVEDIIALNEGIYQGVFADCNVPLEFLELEKKAEITNKQSDLDFNQRYINDMRLLQQAFEDGLAENQDINSLNEIITNKMQDLARRYLEANDILESLNPDTSKRLPAGESQENTKLPVKKLKVFKKGDNSWKDTPIDEILWSRMCEEGKAARRKILQLPNIPEDYEKYTINELIKMNEEYIKSEKGRNR